MASYTVSYSSKVKGFPSFYSYIPQNMIGMNNRFYSFDNGALYLHNSDNVNHSNFYGVDNDTTISTVINQSPLENKVFKTINIEGTKAWDVTIQSEQQLTGYIDKEWFDKKEGSFFAHIRNTGGDAAVSEDLPIRSMTGLSQTINNGQFFSTGTLTFAAGFDVSSASVGDMMYFAPAPYTEFTQLGLIATISFLTTGHPIITYYNTTGSGVHPANNSNPFIMVSKSSMAESHGIIGNYAEIVLTNSETTAQELYAIESEVMASKPS